MFQKSFPKFKVWKNAWSSKEFENGSKGSMEVQKGSIGSIEGSRTVRNKFENVNSKKYSKQSPSMGQSQLQPVLEDREKTFDSTVSVEFKVEGIFYHL